MIKQNKEIYEKMGPEDVDPLEYMNPDNEEEFSPNQREFRNEMYKYLMEKNC